MTFKSKYYNRPNTTQVKGRDKIPLGRRKVNKDASAGNELYSEANLFSGNEGGFQDNTLTLE